MFETKEISKSRKRKVQTAAGDRTWEDKTGDYGFYDKPLGPLSFKTMYIHLKTYKDNITKVSINIMCN